MFEKWWARTVSAGALARRSGPDRPRSRPGPVFSWAEEKLQAPFGYAVRALPGLNNHDRERKQPHGYWCAPGARFGSHFHCPIGSVGVARVLRERNAKPRRAGHEQIGIMAGRGAPAGQGLVEAHITRAEVFPVWSVDSARRETGRQ